MYAANSNWGKRLKTFMVFEAAGDFQISANRLTYKRDYRLCCSFRAKMLWFWFWASDLQYVCSCSSCVCVGSPGSPTSRKTCTRGQLETQDWLYEWLFVFMRPWVKLVDTDGSVTAGISRQPWSWAPEEAGIENEWKMSERFCHWLFITPACRSWETVGSVTPSGLVFVTPTHVKFMALTVHSAGCVNPSHVLDRLLSSPPASGAHAVSFTLLSQDAPASTNHLSASLE